MAITYVNVFEDNLYDNLRTIIGAEFDQSTGLDINNIKLGEIEESDTGKFTHGFLTVVPVEDIHLEWVGQMDERRYTLQLNYYRQFHRMIENTYDELSDFAEHLRQLLANNSDYSPSGVYKWHDGIVELVDYSQDLEELEELTEEPIEGVSVVRLTFSAVVATEFV